MERIAKLFKNGRNQAVRLPVEFEFDTDRVYPMDFKMHRGGKGANPREHR